MTFWSRIRSWLHATVQRSCVESEMDAELRFHVEMYADDLIRSGVPREEALRRARLNFGGIESAKEECREARGVHFAETLWQDLRYGARTMLRSPGFTVTAVLALALGIGANTAIFSVVNAVLLRPLPFDQPERLIQVWHTPPQKSFPGVPTFAVSPANFLDWRRQNHSFQGLSAYGFGRYTLTGSGHPEAIRMVAATVGLFSLLHAQPLLGRGFLDGEDEPGREHEVVLSYGFWHSYFAGNSDVVGKNIQLNGQAFTVVGVMRPEFDFPIFSDPDSRTQMWKPLAWTDQERAIRGDHNYAVIGRLQDGVTLRQAQAELDAISSRLAQDYPNDNRGWGAIAIPLRDDLVGDVRPALLILLGAVALVLLIACANVANLVLARALSRRKEVAVRTALGATRRRLLQQVISETLLLACAGGVLGLVLAHYSLIWMVKFLAQWLPRSGEIALDGWVLAFTLGISLLTGFAAGLLPALRVAKADLNQALKQGLGRTAADSGGSRTRNVLVVSEVALSLMLLIGAGLLIRSLWVLHNVNPGFDARGVVTMNVSIPINKFTEPAQQISYFARVLDRVRNLPGVQSAGLIDSLPLSEDGSHQPISQEGRPAAPMADLPEVEVRLISPGYMDAMHIPLLSGRELDDSDVAGRVGAVLISESMAKFFWPQEDPIGKRLTLYFFPELTRVVVGVVADVKISALNETQAQPTLYFPLAQMSAARGETWHSFGMKLAVRTSAEPLSVVPVIAGAVRATDGEVPLLNIRTMDDSVSASLSPARFTMWLLGAFAGLALLLAMVGIYSVMSFAVSRRTNEIGIRLALGASRNDVLALIVRQALLLALIGSAIGIVGALSLSRLMASQLYGVRPTDPLTFVTVAALLLIVSLAASYIPARRAMRVDPMVALRYE
ncbi:MAG TPA: ABC transporter permease [Candidatus Acidoferrales bacterium]|nr:ABC transporter permease [Candidatus Acidoferrales bacterium]